MQCDSMEVARAGQVITPEVPANGKGYRSLYSFQNLVEIRIVEQLGKFGVPQKRIQRYIEDLRHSKGRWLCNEGADGFVVLDNLWRWGCGSTLELALEPLAESVSPISLIAINLGAIKRSLRLSMQNNMEIEVNE